MKKPFYLVPVIATMLVGCGEDTEYVRDAYTSTQDCMTDWSYEQCNPIETQDYDEEGNVVTQNLIYGPQYPNVWMMGNTSYGGRSSVVGYHGPMNIQGSPSYVSGSPVPFSRAIGGIKGTSNMVSSSSIKGSVGIRGGFGSVGHGFSSGG